MSNCCIHMVHTRPAAVGMRAMDAVRPTPRANSHCGIPQHLVATCRGAEAPSGGKHPSGPRQKRRGGMALSRGGTGGGTQAVRARVVKAAWR